jgi:hypothetical protein
MKRAHSRGLCKATRDAGHTFVLLPKSESVTPELRLVISEDGYLYSIDARSNVRESIFLKTAISAAYTPVAIGQNGYA